MPQVRGSFVFQGLLFRDASLCALVEALTGGRAAAVASRFNCRAKLRDAPGASFPWHQDHAFFRMQYILKKEEPKRLLAAWAPLVAVGAHNGGVELLPGSHAAGFVRHGRAGGFLAAAAPPAARGVVPDLEPGDVLLFTDLTLHCSGPNSTDEARWSADWAYELEDGDDVCPPLEGGGGGADADADRATPAEAARMRMRLWWRRRRWWRRRAWAIFLATTAAAVLAAALARLPRNKFT